MDFKRFLAENEFVFFDGAMGTMLQKSGLSQGEIPELWNITHPEILENIHKSYISAGSQIVSANTFGANRLKLSGTGHSVEEVIGAGVALAKKTCKSGLGRAFAALDIGPVGQLLEPTGSLTFEQAYDIFAELIRAGKGADIIIIETMTDLYETKAALLAAKENSDMPVICSMTFEENGRTFTGCSPAEAAFTLEGLGADAIGVNCSLGPENLLPIVEELCRWTTLPVIVQPNAGLPDPVTNEYNVSAAEFAETAAKFAKMGVKIFGGCCGTTPEYIRELKNRLSREKFTPRVPEIPAAVCSYSKTSVINQPRIIGERINPTGKKRFKEALKAGDMDYILSQAVEQAGVGADILDVNVGLLDIDEKAMMVRTVKALQSVTELPLQIDSTDPEVIEAALRVYNGKAIVNSVNGEEKSLSAILPIVKKYGAAVVGLTLDENGIPKTAEGRFAIAEKILNRALELGIPRRDVYIDCLTLTASAEQAAVMETVKALSRVKTELGLKTVLGVSNISFGLPNRELVNSSFLEICLSHGLDLPILNPNSSAMLGAVRAYKLLANIDENASEFIDVYSGEQPAKPQTAVENISADGLINAVCRGLKGEGAAITEKLLETVEPMTIVDDMLIPALDKTGADFESGKIFLPQLILSAGVAQAAFEVIKRSISSEKSVSKGKVVLATVKGDIHDIGKNIVKVLLENYGFEVIDLGRDVPYQAVADAAMADDVKLVGLSALMTTTLKSMEETIKLLRKVKPDVKIVVGGAVLTPEYAEKIGADYYAKNAKATVDAAREVYNC